MANELLKLISQLHQQGYTTVRTGAVPRTFLNQPSLVLAMRAKTHHRVYVSLHDKPKMLSRYSSTTAFAIAGYTGETGFIQRLAIASQLVAQSMTWFARHQVKQVLVNTAVTNLNAQALYQRCGFDEKSERLVVMEHRAQVAQRTTVC